MCSRHPGPFYSTYTLVVLRVKMQWFANGFFNGSEFSFSQKATLLEPEPTARGPEAHCTGSTGHSQQLPVLKLLQPPRFRAPLFSLYQEANVGPLLQQASLNFWFMFHRLATLALPVPPLLSPTEHATVRRDWRLPPANHQQLLTLIRVCSRRFWLHACCMQLQETHLGVQL